MQLIINILCPVEGFGAWEGTNVMDTYND